MLAGCHRVPGVFKPRLPNETRTHSEQFLAVPQTEQQALPKPNWGLALSGGGPRAAAVTLGALKALYDSGLLDSVDVISSVSGSGYTGYWLYSREYRNPSRASRTVGHFGEGSFSPSTFLVGVCDIATTNNFLPYRKGIPRAILGQTPSWQYDRALLRTYGQANYHVDSSYMPRVPKPWYRRRRPAERRAGWVNETRPAVQVADLKSLVESGRVPNLIVNTNVVRPTPRFGYFDGIFEFTPLHRGNASLGYVAWSPADTFAFRDAVRISGAAAAFPLKQTIPGRLAGDGATVLTLSDGGHAENLGVVALVRRRVPNIVVFDVEQENGPALELNSYRDLQRRLRVWGDSLVVPALDDTAAIKNPRSARGAYVGYIADGGGTRHTRVFYMKLSLPASLDAAVTKDSAWQAEADREAEKVDSVLKANRHANGKAWRCSSLAELAPSLSKLGTREMRRMLPGEALGPIVQKRVWKAFPGTSTFNLNYDLSRTIALVGLGHFLGTELAGIALASPPAASPPP